LQNDLRLVVDTLPGLVWTALPDGQVDFLNQPWCDYTGMDLAQASGAGWLAAVCPDDLPMVTAAWTRVLETGESYDVKYRIHRNDGAYRWFHVRGLPLRDAEGRIVRWYVLQVDIEDQWRAEAMLAAENRLLAMVAAGQPLADILTELCRIVEGAADAHCSVVLVDPTGSHLENGVAPSLAASFVSAINGRPVNADSGPCAMAAFLNEQVISADIAVDERWAEWGWCRLALAHGLRACWSTPIHSKNGKALGAFAMYYEAARTPTALDQSLIEQFTHLASIAIERAQADAALERARSELARVARITAAGGLTASIAHEVNQPLSGIITNAGTSLRMLTDDPPNVEGAIETVRRTIRDGNRAAQVVARVRALYRKGETASDWVDLNEAAREVIALSASEIQRAGAIVRAELAGDLPLVRGDRVQLQQVMLNLLLNGMEAMSATVDRPRHLVVGTAREEDDRVRLYVRDTGSGLDPENLNQPFEPFYTTKGGGMGIGLSVSRSIIQSHDGRLWATTNDGPGATFAFSIPREFDRAPVSP
jgi:PAS domain S-box-containing protein